MTISPEFLLACRTYRDAAVTVYAPGSRRTVEEEVMATHAAMTWTGPRIEILGMCIDPCSRILYRSLSTARVNETEQDRLDRIRRRKAKDAMDAEAAAAKSTKPRTR